MTDQYLSVVYDQTSHPYNDYPSKLCAYLFQEFNLKNGMKMLEPGCGRGEFLSNFQRLGLDVIGLDISKEAQNFGHDFDIVLCDVENEPMPFGNNTFDVIYSKSFIEHLHYPERYLKEAYRVLKPDGLLVTLVPDWESNYKTYFDDFTHRSPFTKIALADAYKMYNFNSDTLLNWITAFAIFEIPMALFYLSTLL